MDDTRKLFRLLDANLNRAREGLRVIEDAFRFLRDDADAQERIKGIRHSLIEFENRIDPSGKELLASRASDEDVGAFLNTETEMSRESSGSVIKASLKRVQEALRSLEEYGKLIDVDAAGIAKKLRFDMYDFEKKYGYSSGSDIERGENDAV